MKKITVGDCYGGNGCKDERRLLRSPGNRRCKMVKLFRRIGSIVAVLAGMILSCTVVLAEEAARGSVPADPASLYRSVGLGMAAAFAIAASIIGAGHAVGRIGSAALGAAAERPELLTRSILFVALAEGLAVLGFAIAMMLIQKM
ncbi:MAG: ATP synthase subunit C [Proteobacteria bacterium]|nr:ATP synthase subunit C [Pseudomonadota bacterium]